MKKQLFKDNSGFGLIQAIILGGILVAASSTVVMLQKKSANEQKVTTENVKNKLGEISSVSLMSKLFSYDTVGSPKEIAAMVIPDPYILSGNENHTFIIEDEMKKRLGNHTPWGFNKSGQTFTIFKDSEQNIKKEDYRIKGTTYDTNNIYRISTVTLEREKDKVNIIIPSLGEAVEFKPDCHFSIKSGSSKSMPAKKDVTVPFETEFSVELICTGLLPKLPTVQVKGVRFQKISESYTHDPGGDTPVSHRSIPSSRSPINLWSAKFMMQVPLCCGGPYGETANCYPKLDLKTTIEGVTHDVSLEVNFEGDMKTAPKFGTICTMNKFYNMMSSNYGNFTAPYAHIVTSQYEWMIKINPECVLLSVRKEYISHFYDKYCQKWKNVTHTTTDEDGNVITHTTKVKDGGTFECTYGYQTSNYLTTVPAANAYWMPGYPIKIEDSQNKIPVRTVASSKINTCEHELCGTRQSLGCFDSNTMIYMMDGSLKRIDEIRPGDKLYNPITKKVAVVDYIISGAEKKPMLEIYHENGSELVTSEHPFLTKNGLIKAMELLSGDIVTLNGNDIEILFIEKINSSNNDLPVVWNVLVNRHSEKTNDHFILTSSGLPSGDLYLQRKLAGDK